MKWKSFKNEIPQAEMPILIREIDDKYNLKHTIFSRVKRPYDVNPDKYNINYYQIEVAYHSSQEWVDLDESFAKIFEWLDPFEDKKILTQQTIIAT